jgi:hypothetical protein
MTIAVFANEVGSMPHIMAFPNDSGGFDRERNQFVMPKNKTSYLYLVAGDGLKVSVDPPAIISASCKEEDEKAAHNRPGLSAFENSVTIRKITLTSGSAEGRTLLRARNEEDNDWIKPLDVFVVADAYARRAGDAIEPTLRAELERLPLRQAVIRVAHDQMTSRVRTNEEGIVLYRLPKEYGKLWCGAFAYWCWNQAAAAKKVANPFGGSSEPLLSPQKAIHWGMQSSTPGQLLQYAGPDPMVKAGTVPPQELREIGYQGCYVEPGDIALWREGNWAGFKHVSFVESVSGSTFVDLNGNAYDAGSGSALARIAHPDMGRKLPDGSYKVFFLHLTI